MTSSSSLSSSPEHVRHNQALGHHPPVDCCSSDASTDSLLTDSLYEVIKPSPTSRPSNKRSSSSKTNPSDIDDHLKSNSSKSRSSPAANVVQFTSKSSLLYKPSTKTSYTEVYHHRPSEDVMSTVSSMYEVLTDNRDEDYYQMLDCYQPKKPQKSVPKKPKRRVPERIYENL